MDNLKKPLKTKVLESVANDVYVGLVEMVPSKRPERVILYGASQSDLISVMCLANNNSRRHRFNIEPGQLNGEYSINIGDKYLEKLAFFAKEDFYSLPKEKRRTCNKLRHGF